MPSTCRESCAAESGKIDDRALGLFVVESLTRGVCAGVCRRRVLRRRLPATVRLCIDGHQGDDCDGTALGPAVDHTHHADGLGVRTAASGQR